VPLICSLILIIIIMTYVQCVITSVNLYNVENNDLVLSLSGSYDDLGINLGSDYTFDYDRFHCPLVAIYCYCTARRLILILPSIS